MHECHPYRQGKALAKDASGSGANWCTGIASDDPLGVVNPMNSRLDFDGTVTATDMDRATDAREKGRIGILGSALSYAGSSPRVTSEKIGRDVNPLGRGSGMALVGGQLNLGRIAPSLPQGLAVGGSGSSVNNADEEPAGAWLIGPGFKLNMECFQAWAEDLMDYKEGMPAACTHVRVYGNCGSPCTGSEFLEDPQRCAEAYCTAWRLMRWGNCERVDYGWYAWSKECYPYKPDPEHRWAAGCVQCESMGDPCDISDEFIWIPNKDMIDEELYPIVRMAIHCLTESGHPKAGKLYNVLTNVSIRKVDWFGQASVAGLFNPLNTTIYINPHDLRWEYREDKNEIERVLCKNVQLLLHEAYHGTDMWSWRDALGHVFPEWWFYGPRYNAADAVSEEVLRACLCCNGKTRFKDLPQAAFITAEYGGPYVSQGTFGQGPYEPPLLHP